ncbi:hypothetical protein K505DRAFT_395212 [Melanomma pulvis-pyrius CBS 109.77]|uniref:Uncharacterized protein n=1 Tax=Melanomma pulvis-pyrius CBS 109.77 TaxID=1314802 RepID=A0A6A6XQ16_9PLEO|nr:hypothetical protein K505DRAFT_395212 [Melanomma pulvis-pyrius CBS 109.77]
MPSLLKKLTFSKANKTALASVTDNVNATPSTNGPKDGGVMFKLKSPISFMRPRPNFIAMTTADIIKHRQHESSTSTTNAAQAHETISTSQHISTESLPQYDLDLSANTETRFKPKSVLAPRPDVVAINSDKVNHGKWCKTKKMVQKFLHRKDGKRSADKRATIDDNSECGHKFRHGPCKHYMIKPDYVDNFAGVPSCSNDSKTPESKTPEQMGMLTLIQKVKAGIEENMSLDISPCPTQAQKMGMETLIRKVEAEIEENQNEVSPCPPQIAPICPLPDFLEAFRGATILDDGTVDDSSPISTDFMDQMIDSDETFPSSPVTEDSLPNTARVLPWIKRPQTSEERTLQIFQNGRQQVLDNLQASPSFRRGRGQGDSAAYGRRYTTANLDIDKNEAEEYEADDEKEEESQSDLDSWEFKADESIEIYEENALAMPIYRSTPQRVIMNQRVPQPSGRNATEVPLRDEVATWQQSTKQRASENFDHEEHGDNEDWWSNWSGTTQAGINFSGEDATEFLHRVEVAPCYPEAEERVAARFPISEDNDDEDWVSDGGSVTQGHVSLSGRNATEVSFRDGDTSYQKDNEQRPTEGSTEDEDVEYEDSDAGSTTRIHFNLDPPHDVQQTITGPSLNLAGHEDFEYEDSDAGSTTRIRMTLDPLEALPRARTNMKASHMRLPSDDYAPLSIIPRKIYNKFLSPRSVALHPKATAFAPETPRRCNSTSHIRKDLFNPEKLSKFKLELFKGNRDRRRARD